MDINLQIIEAVKICPLLYKTNATIAQRQRGWHKIAEQIKMPEVLIKSRWHILREHYIRKCINGQSNGHATGDRAGDFIYKQQMEFLRPHIRNNEKQLKRDQTDDEQLPDNVIKPEFVITEKDFENESDNEEYVFLEVETLEGGAVDDDEEKLQQQQQQQQHNDEAHDSGDDGGHRGDREHNKETLLNALQHTEDEEEEEDEQQINHLEKEQDIRAPQHIQPIKQILKVHPEVKHIYLKSDKQETNIKENGEEQTKTEANKSTLDEQMTNDEVIHVEDTKTIENAQSTKTTNDEIIEIDQQNDMIECSNYNKLANDNPANTKTGTTSTSTSTAPRKDNQNKRNNNNNNHKSNDRCEDDIFGELVVAIIKRMEADKKRSVKKDIMNLLLT